MLNADRNLIKINGVWVRNPDPDSWGPTNNPNWTPNTGRVSTGTMTGSRQFFKYTIPLTWTMIPEADLFEIQQLIEDGADYIPVEFYHRCGYLKITCYSATVTPTGILYTDGSVFYKKCTVKLVEQ